MVASVYIYSHELIETLEIADSTILYKFSNIKTHYSNLSWNGEFTIHQFRMKLFMNKNFMQSPKKIQDHEREVKFY